MAACLRRSFQELPPTHELRVTVHGVMSDRDLSAAIGKFLRRLRYQLGRHGSNFEYFAINEWSEGHRHTHIVVRASADLTPQLVRDLWRKTLPWVPFTHHCAPVRSPIGLANYVVKHLKDAAKKELPPEAFKGRLFTYSRHFFTKQIAQLWREQVRNWYPSSNSAEGGFGAAQAVTLHQ